MKNLLTVSLLLSAGAALAQENYATAWSQHQYVIVNSALAGVNSNQVNFPVLVRLGAADSAIFSQAKAGGADLRFTKVDDATRLPHQIESWNAATRSAAIWVLVDTVYAPRQNQALRIHWGNANAADSSNGAAVFKTANGFQAVYHMSGAANESDATTNALTATQNGTAPSAPGAVGPARTVSSGNYFRINGSASGPLNFAEGSNYTISAWVQAASFPSFGSVISKHDNAWALKLNQAGSDWEFFEFGSAATTPGWNYVNAGAGEHQGTWHLLTGFRSTSVDTAMGLYVDGVLIGLGFSTAESSTPRVLNTDVTIGAQPTTNTSVTRFFDGQIDEVRLSSVTRSPDWVKLEYENQKPGSAVVRLMNTIPASIARSGARAESFSAKASGDGLLFRFAADGAARAQVSVTDMRGAAVWTQVADARSGSLAWNGRAASGALAPQGVYAVRVRLLDARGAVIRTLENRVPLTR